MGEDPLPLARRDDLQLRDPGVRLRHRRAQQRLELRGQARDRLGAEHVAVVDEDPVDPVRFLLQEELQVEAGGPGLDVERLGRQARPAALAVVPVALQGEDDLEDRRPGDVPDDSELPDEPLEGQLLVGVGLRGAAADPGDQLPEGRIAAQLGAHRQHVDEQPDHAFELAAGPAAHRRADREVLLAGVAPEQDLVGRQQRHVEGRAALPGEPGHRVRQPAVQPEAVRGAGEGLLGGASAVGGQLQRGDSGEPLPPVGEVLLGDRAFALPQGVVAVLDLQVGQVGAAVEGAELLGEDLGGPAVGRDVVDRDQQRVVVLGQPDQGGADERSLGQVEGPGRLGAQDVRGGRLVGGGAAQLDVGGLPDEDVRAAVLVGGEAHPQALVPRHDGAQGELQPVGVEGAAQPQGDRDRVGGASRCELLHEPQPLLPERERDRPVRRTPGDGRGPHGGAAAQALLEEGPLGVGEPEVARGQAGRGCHTWLTFGWAARYI
ncbi:hypothetical protein Pve01_29120 [Planomonospora venezuelensis]|nr:hypothetical protein Pve01_29120 [Planomonospora venezuelensis]